MREKTKNSNTKDYSNSLLSLNKFMLEQAEVSSYDQLVKVIVDQLSKYLHSIVTVFNEYDQSDKVLRSKEIKAEDATLEIIAKIGGKRLDPIVIPVSDKLYEKMITERVSAFSTLNEVSGGAIPKTISLAISQALNTKSHIGLSFVTDRHMYGTTFIVLNEEPDQAILEIVKTYVYFTSISLKRVLTEEALRKSEQELKTITDNMTDIVAMADVEGKFTYLSESNHRVLGYKPGDLLGKSIFSLVYIDDLPTVQAIYLQSIAEGKNSAKHEYRIYKKNGDCIWTETIGKLLTDNTGQVSGTLFTSRDITKRKNNEIIIQEEREQLLSLFNSIEYMIYVADPATYEILYVNPKLANTLRKNCVGKLCYEEFQGLDAPCPFCTNSIILSAKGQPHNWEHYNAQLDKHFEIIDQIIRWPDGRHVRFEMAVDITERKKTEAYIRYIGYHDKLTDLYNRYYFEDCKEELKDIPVISIIMTDVNGLKLVNDTYGHEAGDELLKKYAELLKKSFKQSDLIFRWGGDEFIIILKNTEEAGSWELCHRLIQHCGETYVKDIPLSISVGISSKVQGENIDTAIREAEDIMYKNKLNESKSSKNLIMKTLLQTLSEKSFETKEHIERMGLIGRQMGEKLDLSPSELARLKTLTMLHDIGKINIDSSILLKKTSLTETEWQEIKKHPEVGYRITRTTEEFAYIAEEILAHHERWDGKGYPQGLEKDHIPYLARILNLIDSYDVMSNGRPYKKKMSKEDIIAEVENCSGKQFDPELAKVFIACLREGIFESMS